MRDSNTIDSDDELALRVSEPAEQHVWTTAQGYRVEIAGQIRDPDEGQMVPCIALYLTFWGAEALAQELQTFSEICELLDTEQRPDPETADALIKAGQVVRDRRDRPLLTQLACTVGYRYAHPNDEEGYARSLRDLAQALGGPPGTAEEYGKLLLKLKFSAEDASAEGRRLADDTRSLCAKYPEPSSDRAN